MWEGAQGGINGVGGATDVIPRAAGPLAPYDIPARNLAQASGPSWSRNPGVGERYCCHDSDPSGALSTPTSPNSPFTRIEGQTRKADQEGYVAARTHDDTQRVSVGCCLGVWLAVAA